MARPKKQINKVEFEKLCFLQCTMQEICYMLDVTDKTLTKWCKETYDKSFSEVYAEKREPGKVSLRRSQFKLAEKNATMAIWLGKQYLGQRDEQYIETKQDIKQENPLQGLSTEELKGLLKK